ncbi:MAG: sulfatase [Phycisphaerae bacterium]|nr:sulfatase [Phycisphaerae bacterium]
MEATKTNRRRFLKTIAAGAAALALPKSLSLARRAAGRPNILFIMADDHAVNAISCYGSRLRRIAKTPNIDRIAAEGARLLNCFCTNSICVPSRATILTGQYSHVNGVYTLADKLDPERQNVAKLLQAAGYQTALLGKWHLKTDPTGFDHWNILPGQGRYHNPVMREKPLEEDNDKEEDRNEGNKPEKEKKPGTKTHEGFSTDVITDLSLDWLKKRDKDKPFFLMTHFKNSHGPWHFAERHADLYKDVEIPEPESLWEDLKHRSPGSKEYGYTISGIQLERMQKENYPTGPLDTTDMDQRQKTKATYQKYLKDYLRCVAAIDENVGKLLDFLREEKLEENTVVIYTSDQGLFLGEHGYIDKRWMFEESLKMPFLIRYPGEIRPGTVSDDIIINADFAPTFLDYARARIPSDMQGRSLRPNLQGQTPDDWRTSMYYRYWQHCSRPAHYGIRTKRYKLIFFYGLGLDMKGAEKKPTKPGVELYDLMRDPFELNNVYDHPAYANVVKRLKTQLKDKKAELGDTDEKYPEMLELVEKYW